MRNRQGIPVWAQQMNQILVGVVLLLVACVPQTTAPRAGTAAISTPDLPQWMTPSMPATVTAESVVSLTVRTCRESQGQVRQESLQSTVLPGKMIYTIYTPPCYSTDQVYPVLYLLHGLTYTDDQWVRLGITDVADRLIASGEMGPLVIVFPYNPETKEPEESNFGKALVESLVPWIDTHYSTCIQKECRAIGGLSRGGGWAFYIVMNYPGVFGAVGGHSPAMSLNDPLKFATSFEKNWDQERIWMDVGQEDPEVNFLTTVNESLINADIPHTFLIYQGTHNEAYWRSHVEDYLRWYAGIDQGAGESTQP